MSRILKKAFDNKSMLTLYKLDFSPPVRAVYMVINALGIRDVKYIDVDILKKEQITESYLKINSQHTVPTLIDNGFTLWDSHAIAVYLNKLYAKDDSLYPRDPKRSAVIDQRLHFDSGVLFPALRNAVRPVVAFNATSFDLKAFAEIKTGYRFVEKFLTSAFLAGDEVTVADICCVATISTSNAVLPIDPDKYPKTASWLQRCSEFDFYKKGNEPGLKLFKSVFAAYL